MASEDQREHPVVFISYSHDSPEHADRVLTLSNRLREDGINCILDQYEESPPEGWPRWAERCIREADFILMICTETYCRRVMGEEKAGVGQGGIWEGSLIYQHIYNADAKNTRVLPVLFADGQVSHIPTPLMGAARYFVGTPEGYELLYRRLTHQLRVRKPGLGRLKTLPAVEPRARKQDFAWPVQGAWPGVSLPRGGPKVSVPFAGRREELRQLASGMGGGKRVVAVVGMAGQGKSCLIGEWYKRGLRLPQGVGLFWRKVYEAGYTFDRFLDDLHLYLTGESIDRVQIKTVRDRATVVENLLAAKPCWIVLDGVERWLKRWASDPDVDARNATPDDRAGCDPALDEFLKRVSFWENESRLLLTTRAAPSALDENPPLTIGCKHGHSRRLTDLKSEEAIRLLKDLGIGGTKETMREAVSAYGCHAYAVHVLGVLIRDRYGGDISRWREINPLEEPKLVGLFERIIETCREDLALLELIACSLGPAPVEMLAKLTGRDESSVRKALAELKNWQMIEFEDSEAEQHTVVRRFLTRRMSQGGTNPRQTRIAVCWARMRGFLGRRMSQNPMQARQKRIATWWAQHAVPVNPTTIEEIRPQFRAIEHFVAARDPDAAIAVFLRKPSPESRYSVGEWLWQFGYFDEVVRLDRLLMNLCTNLIKSEHRHDLLDDLARCHTARGVTLGAQGRLSKAVDEFSDAIKIQQDLLEGKGRRKLRNDLAMCYDNRGYAFQEQGHLAKAIADFDRAIEIRQGLVKWEWRHGRRCELHSVLANCYANRGNALRNQGHLAKAVADHGQAIRVYEGLVELEGRHDLLDDLAMCYNSRGAALRLQDHLAQAIADHAHAIQITKRLVEQEGRRELRNDLAHGYIGRGLALAAQGHLAEAIADYGRGVEIREGLVEREGRRDLRSDLAVSLRNRGIARSKTGEWQQAGEDIERSEGLLRAIVQEGQRHILGSLLKTLGFRCRYAKELGDPAKAMQRVNEGVRWFLEEREQDRTTEPLLKAVAEFAECVRDNQELLLEHGLDAGLWAKLQSTVETAGET